MVLRKSATRLAIGTSPLFAERGNPKSYLIILSSSLHSSNQTNSRFGFDEVKNLNDALCLFDQMLLSKPMTRNRDYNKLFNILAKMEHYSQVINMFKILSLSGFPVDVYNMTTVIGCYSQLKEVDLGFAVLSSMLKRGFAPNVVTISCLIKGLFLQERIVEAVELFEKLRRGVLFDVDELSSYFHSSNRPTLQRNCRYGFDDIQNLDDALAVLDKMLQIKPMPSVLNFNKLFNIFVEMKNYSVVIHLFKEFTFWGCPVNDYTMTTVINCYCNLKEVDLGFAVLASMLKHGYAPDIVTVSCLIKGLFLEGKVKKAVQLFKKLIKDELCEVDEFTISIVLHGLCQSGNVVAAVELLGELENQNYEPNVVAYTTVVNCLCRQKTVNDALGLLSRMIERGIRPNVVAYTTLIHKLCKCSRLVEANKLWKQMVGNKVYPNIKTFSILVDAYCKERLIRKAEKLVQIMEGRGIEPDVLTYTSLINGYCLIGQLDKAKESLNLMVEKGLKPDVVSYGTMINGYCKHMKINLVIETFKKMLSSGLKPNTQTYNIMIQGLCQEGMFEEVKELQVEMEESGCFPNSITLYIIIRGCLKHYDKFDSFDLLRQIVERNCALTKWTFSQVLQQMRGNDEDVGRMSLIQKLVSDDNRYLMA